MRRFLLFPTIALAFLLAIPVAGPAQDCPGSLCAGVTTDHESAYVDWWGPQGGGHIDYGMRTKRFWQGGVVVQTYTESWASLGTPFYGCGNGPLPAGAVTKNSDGSVTLSFTDLGGQPGCSATVTWTPTVTGEMDQIFSGHWSRIDPNTGGFEFGTGANQARPASASGVVAGWSIATGPDQQWAQMQTGVGGCATNGYCDF